MGFVSKDNQTNWHGKTVGICAIPVPSGLPGITSVYFTILLIAWIVVNNISSKYIVTLHEVGIRHKSFISQNTDGPEGRHNNLQSAWCLAELFFWSDLSWSQADLCANSYVIPTCFSLVISPPSCMHYISYVGITYHSGPKGCPNNLQSAWHLAKAILLIRLEMIASRYLC